MKRRTGFVETTEEERTNVNGGLIKRENEEVNFSIFGKKIRFPKIILW